MSSTTLPDADSEVVMSPTKATRAVIVLHKELKSLADMAESEKAGVEQILDADAREKARDKIVGQYEDAMVHTQWTVALMAAEWRQILRVVDLGLLSAPAPPYTHPTPAR